MELYGNEYTTKNKLKLKGSMENVEGERKMEGRIRKCNREVNVIRVHYMHAWKYLNEMPYFAQLINAN
jgi:hypothetical protein